MAESTKMQRGIVRTGEWNIQEHQQELQTVSITIGISVFQENLLKFLQKNILFFIKSDNVKVMYKCSLMRNARRTSLHFIFDFDAGTDVTHGSVMVVGGGVVIDNCCVINTPAI